MPGPEGSSTYLSRPAPPAGRPSQASGDGPWSFLSQQQQKNAEQAELRSSGSVLPWPLPGAQPPPPPPPPRGRRPNIGGGGGGAGLGTVLLSIVLSAAATAGAMHWQALKERFDKVS